MKLALIDVETTGCKPPEDRVIDIGIVLVDDFKITDEWESLINPECEINPFITKLTGISEMLVNSAPRFSDVHEKVAELLDGRIFVAHNASFDYSFIKHEFKRIHIPFQSTRLCTVKLSRHLNPKERRHNLDAIIERLSLTIENRHRALPDAKVIFSFLQKWRVAYGEDIVVTKIHEISKRPSLPPHISKKIVDNLSTSIGIYVFYNQSGAPLYVGKSLNIKERVMAHFYSDTQSSKELHINQELHHIEYIECSGELEALLMESRFIKELTPIYNRRLRFSKKLWIAKKTKNTHGYYELNVEEVERLYYRYHDSIELIAHSKKQLLNTLRKLCQEHALCPKLCGLEKGTGACFSYQLEQCNGACIGKEKVDSYNLKVLATFNDLSIADWPFEGPIIIHEHNDQLDKDSYHLVNNWSVYKTSNTDVDIYDATIDHELPIDNDGYIILKNYISKHMHDSTIIRMKY
jgi:DNA polymerase-3 subunit epsilon